MKTVAFVPIRLNSKRVVGKNLKLLGNKPLMCYILETLTYVNGIDEIYAYCSDEKIDRFLPKGVNFLKRPVELDADDTLGEEIYEAFTKTIDSDIYILAHTTSPFIKPSTMETALQKIKKDGYDSAFSVEKIQTFAWYKGNPLNYGLKNIPRTQTIEPIFIETSEFYMFRSDVWKCLHQRVGKVPYMSIVDKIEGVDIDWPEDFAFAEQILKEQRISL